MASKDLEWAEDKALPIQESPYSHDHGYSQPEAIREADLVPARGVFFRWLQKASAMGVEVRGIERVPEDERDGKHTIGLLLLWFSVNSVVSTFPIGLLAQAYYYLDFQSAMAAIVAFTAIGAACTAFIATLGPQTGLRTMVISRYSIGFSTTAVILGGQTLTNVSDGKLPLEAAIVIIVVVAEEHFIFRKHVIPGGYDLNVYDTISQLPVGIAGIIACCAGVGAAVVGMAQVWYIGPLGAVFGTYGGDLGFEMSAAATAIVYPPLRWLEYRHFGR
ncbi:hypothetical protein P7C73_g5056, partial [Tremellales sp. Uapishka_1]